MGVVRIPGFYGTKKKKVGEKIEKATSKRTDRLWQNIGEIKPRLSPSCTKEKKMTNLQMLRRKENINISYRLSA